MTEAYDPASVRNPSYYKVFGPCVDTEAIDVIRSVLTEEQFEGYLMGTVLKYKLRGGDKGDHVGDRIKAARFKEILTKELMSRGNRSLP